jgi:hypothetical protein
MKKLPTKEEIWEKWGKEDLSWTNMAMNSMRDYALEVLTAYTEFLLKEGYVDSDVRDEPPTPIDQFILKFGL